MRTSFIVTSALALAFVAAWTGTAAAQVCELGDERSCKVGTCPGTQTCVGTPLHPHWGTCVKNDPLCVTQVPPAPTPVECFVFNDGGADMAGPSDAIYFAGRQQACIPDGTATGTCRRWFGECRTADASHTPVNFSVFDANRNSVATSGAIYLRDYHLPCVPGGSLGVCFPWFGDPVSNLGQQATCRLFDDGYANMTGPTTMIDANGPASVCLPGGPCRKWFGRCSIP
jgi:hypothetical protein